MPNYSPVSVEVYGKPAGPIRLYDQGDFYRGFFLNTDKFPVIFYSRDSKAQRLEQEYGNEIFGLRQQDKKEVAQYIIGPDIREYYKNLYRGK